MKVIAVWLSDEDYEYLNVDGRATRAAEAILNSRLDVLRSTPRQAMADGINRAEQNADPEWKAAAYKAIRSCASELPDFTADDVWPRIPEEYQTHEPAALGPIFQKAKKAGLVYNTGQTVQSRNPRRHRKVTIWTRSES